MAGAQRIFKDGENIPSDACSLALREGLGDRSLLL